MKPFVISLLFLPFLLLQTHGHSNTTHHPANIVVDTCKKCSSSDPNVNYTVCIDFFHSNPKSYKSDLKGLGVIAAELAKTKAAKIRSTVRSLLKKHPRPLGRPVDKTKPGLEDCLEFYEDAVSSLSDSAKAIKEGRYDDANLQISAALDDPDTCEQGFTDLKVKSPLTKVNDEFSGYVVIALGVTAMLEGNVGN